MRVERCGITASLSRRQHIGPNLGHGASMCIKAICQGPQVSLALLQFPRSHWKGVSDSLPHAESVHPYLQYRASVDDSRARAIRP